METIEALSAENDGTRAGMKAKERAIEEKTIRSEVETSERAADEEEPEEEEPEEEEQGQEQDEDGEPVKEAFPLPPGPGGALPPTPPPPPDTSGATAVGSSTDDGEVPTLRATMVVTGTDKRTTLPTVQVGASRSF
jgi:hypothetical protein